MRLTGRCRADCRAAGQSPAGPAAVSGKSARALPFSSPGPGTMAFCGPSARAATGWRC